MKKTNLKSLSHSIRCLFIVMVCVMMAVPIYPQAASDGSDIRFIDENGEFLPFELDTWNTSGESVFWVKVPKYRQGTKVTMCKTLRASCAFVAWSGRLTVTAAAKAETAIMLFMAM